jgi:hypothetical protein
MSVLCAEQQSEKSSSCLRSLLASRDFPLARLRISSSVSGTYKIYRFDIFAKYLIFNKYKWKLM